MADTAHPARQVHPEVGHETSDASFRWVLTFAVTMIVAAIVMHVVLWVMFRAYMASEKPGKPPVSALAETERKHEPPEPRLEGLQQKLEAVKHESAIEGEESYAWVNREAKIARVPIDEAMRLILAQPDRLKAETKGRRESPLPVPSNSGRSEEEKEK
jgi:hypothetical protein